jgi:hypothetical protein
VEGNKFIDYILEILSNLLLKTYTLQGELNGRVGTFPSNFVVPVTSGASRPAIISSTFEDHARALFDYSAQEPNELSFKVRVVWIRWQQEIILEILS